MVAMIACLAVCMSVAVVSGQFYGGAYDGINYGFGFNAVNGDFGGPSAFGGSAAPAPMAMRDGRRDRGPVVFPPPPADAVDETSGVIVGASGYGFVPPNSIPQSKPLRPSSFL